MKEVYGWIMLLKIQLGEGVRSSCGEYNGRDSEARSETRGLSQRDGATTQGSWAHEEGHAVHGGAAAAERGVAGTGRNYVEAPLCTIGNPLIPAEELFVRNSFLARMHHVQILHFLDGILLCFVALE